MFQPWIASTATLFAVLTISSVLYFVYKMSERDYLGEFEHIVLLAVLRLGGQAYSVTVRREIEARNQARGFYRCRLCHPRPAGGKRLCTISRWPSNSERGGRFRVTAQGVTAVNRTQLALRSLTEGLDLLGSRS